ncbi:MAG: aspartate--tRNA ligase [Candidatus Ancillula sp.]|jgi:aspartyl-tRNA synthetase|nr:aspartate--tRNA ligase [Candidatus Ancillula sp.]
MNNYRTKYCGELLAENAGEEVVLSGWIDRRRDHGGVAFIDLRDKSGVAQVVINDEAVAHPLRSEFVLKITGRVRKRPEGQENPRLSSGEIEVEATDVEILNESSALPFQVSTALEEATDEKVGDEVRLKFRYLDLRRPALANALRLRAKVSSTARRVLDELGFAEFETPTLIRSTPEGARDFIVPARLSPGSWYALPQSPQLFKQLLQVAGFEKYYQIARCYRDEDFRADRQPEFTQLDVEASFVGAEDIYALTERLMGELFALIDIKLPSVFPRISFADAMNSYGSDKPDLRFGNPIVELTEYFKDTEFRVFQSDYVGAVVYPGGASLPRRQFDAWQEWARSRGAKGLAYVQFNESELGGPVVKNLSEKEREGLLKAVNAKEGDAVFFAAGERVKSQELLGAVRVEIAQRLGVIDRHLTGNTAPDTAIEDQLMKDAPFEVLVGKDGRKWSIVWVVDFPMFKSTALAKGEGDVAVGGGEWTAVHHAFTAPIDVEGFDKDPENALSDSYDIVLNGNEIGGGSIRIHSRDVQERVFRLMGIDEDEAQEKFGFLLDAFKYGAPPHGGIAFGWDRIVALMAGVASIRDVIAFPKTGNGVDLMQKCPAKITDEQRAEAGVDYEDLD